MTAKVKAEVQAAIDHLGADGTFQDASVQAALMHLHTAMTALKVPVDHRRRLPDERKALTHHFEIASVDGYITVGQYDDGTPGEVFVKISKQGATLSGLLDSFAIMFSIALQYGAPLHVITEKLTGTRFEPSGFTKYPGIEYAKSLTDYISRWLARTYLRVEEQPKAPMPSLLSEPPSSVRPTGGLTGSVVGSDGPPCNKCGSIMQKTGSGDCWICPNCQETSGSGGG